MKKLIAIVLAVILILSIMPFSVIAKDLKRIEITIDDNYDFSQLYFDFSNGKKSATKTRSTFPLTGRFYDQLNDWQKDVYNALVASDITATRVYVTFTNNYTIPSGENASNAISDIVFAAFFAVLRDCPEKFWYKGAGGGTNNAWYSGNDIVLGGVYVNINFHPSYTTGTVTGFYNQLMDAVDSFKPVGATRYEKIRSIHDYIINLATYDPDYDNSSANPYGHQPTGCLLSPYLCVCEGYAEAFKLFADREGIPNMLVCSPSHIWNVILMEDNKWYALDCTWDDPSTGNSNYYVLRYDYFLVGSQTVPSGSSTAFSQEDGHDEENLFTDTKGNSLLNPPLNESSYAPFYPKYTYRTNGVPANDYPGGSIQMINNLIYICPGKTVTGCFNFNSYGSYSYSGGNKTGSTLKFTPSGGSQLTYTVIMHGDVNKDAQFNNTDMTYVTDISTGKRTYSSTAPETYAGDVNGDGVVDGFDLALLDRYQGGSYNFY